MYTGLPNSGPAFNTISPFKLALSQFGMCLPGYVILISAMAKRIVFVIATFVLVMLSTLGRGTILLASIFRGAKWEISVIVSQIGVQIVTTMQPIHSTETGTSPIVWKGDMSRQLTASRSVKSFKMRRRRFTVRNGRELLYKAFHVFLVHIWRVFG
jgi:hypothetical protein